MIYVQQKIDELTYENIQDITNAYDPETIYNEGDLARVGSYLYKSTLDDNEDNAPLENINKFWIMWSVANNYALLDPLEETKTEWVEDGIVEFARGRKDTLGIGNFKAKKVKIQYLDASKVELDSKEYLFSGNRGVNHLYDYIYADFSTSVDEVIYRKLKRLGVYVRVTFSADGENTNCGFMIAGESEDMGKTMDNVSFPYQQRGLTSVPVASFNTRLPRNEVLRQAEKANRLVNESMMFVIDPSENSSHNYIIVVGTIKECNPTASTMSKNTISWQIEKNIQE